MNHPPSERVAFVGAGNMAEALARGLLSGGLCPPDSLSAGDPDPARRNLFAKELGVRAVADNAEAVRGAATVVLAVKPQMLPDVLKALRGALEPDALVLSIAAGLPTRRIEDLLPPATRVVRAMPNTPALVGAGVTALCAGRHAAEPDLARAERLLGAVGRVVRVREQDMDAVTALSGSGPAYVFYIVEAWLRAASRLGLPPGTARILVEDTLAGAARLLTQTGEDPEVLRRRVTSKGGTTEAALRVLEQREAGAAVEAAVEAAAARSRELSNPD